MTELQFEIMLEVVVVLAFAGMALAGHLAYKREWAWWVFHVMLGLFALLCVPGILLGLLVVVTELLKPETMQGLAGGPGFMVAIKVLGVGMLVTFLVTVLSLIPPTRRWLYRWLPAHAESIPQRLALPAVLFILTFGIMQLLILTPEMILELMKRQRDFVGGMVLMQLLLIVLALAGAGLGVSRRWADVRKRLGLEAIPWKAVGFSALGAAALFVVGLLLDMFLLKELMSNTYEFGQIVMATFKMDGNIVVIGIGFLLLSMLVGTGEELFFRGLLQPVVGVFLTSLLFTVIHVQYGLSPLLAIVFLMGLLFGWLRKRFNTTVCILVHGLYDFISFMQIQLS